MNGSGSSGVVLAAVIGIGLSLGLSSAVRAACVNDPNAAQKAAAFTTNPASLLDGPNGPRSPDDVAADVQAFVASNPQALPAVLNILKDLTSKGASTSPLQKAIGTGLGKAANVCKTTDLPFASEIQGNLGATGSPDANSQYAAITGNDPTRAVALSGAAAGSSGGSGGQTSPTAGTFTGGTSFQTFVSNSVSNNPSNYFSASAGSAGSAGGNTTTTIVCTVSTSC